VGIGHTPLHDTAAARNPLGNLEKNTTMGEARVEAFGDRVIAIIVTMMVHELRAPAPRARRPS
jgi:hypothetical protein